MSDDRPVAPDVEDARTPRSAEDVLLPPAQEAPPAEGAQEPTFGPCLKCRAQVDLGETFRVGDGKPNGAAAAPGMRMHRLGASKKNNIGEVCGPVAEALVFHVVFQIAGRHMDRSRLAAPQSPEENYGVLDVWEDALSRDVASRYKPVDKESGQPIIGATPPRIPVVVISWKFLGAM